MKLLLLLAIVVSCLPIACGQVKGDEVCDKSPETLNQYRKPGDIWKINDNGEPRQCKCEIVSFDGHILGPMCNILGCRDVDWKFRQPGSVNKKGCTCYVGSDPNRMDGYTLYHWNCSKSQETIRETCSASGDRRFAAGEKWRDMNKKCVCNTKNCSRCLPQKTCHIDDSCDPSADTLNMTRYYQETWDITKSGFPHKCICDKNGMLPSDLPSYPVCQPLGCRHKNKFYKPGSKKDNYCVCTRGTDPNIMDASTLFHWKCKNPPSDRKCKRGKVSFSVGQTWTETNRRYKAKCTCLKNLFCKICSPKTLCIYEGCKKGGKYYPAYGVSHKDLCMCVKKGSDHISWYEWLCI